MKWLAASLALACFGANSICALETAAPTLELKIVRVRETGKIDVAVRNVAQQALRIWRDSNSWGAARWRVLHISRGELTTYFENPDQVFTRNIPTYDEIAVGREVTVEIDVNGAQWRSATGRAASFGSGDTIVVVYDVPSSDEARKLAVWYGTTADMGAVE